MNNTNTYKHQFQQLYDCAHCKQTGTCDNGPNGMACPLCIDRADIKSSLKKNYRGKIRCGICGGLGKPELMTERMRQRTPYIIALTSIIIFPILILSSSLLNAPNSSQIITLSGTILGSIIVYFFSRTN